MLAGPPGWLSSQTHQVPHRQNRSVLSGGQSLQKAQEDQLALDALDDGRGDLAPGGYTVACPHWSLGAGPLDSKGPFQLEPIAVRGPFHKLAGRGLDPPAPSWLPAGEKGSCISDL